MLKRSFAIFLIAPAFFTFYLSAVTADDGGGAEIAALKAQVQELLSRIEKLEQEQVKTKEEVKKAEAAASSASSGRVDLTNALSRLKMKGRLAAGYFDSGKAGSYAPGSFEAPEAKMMFFFQPDEINTAVVRLNLNNGANNTPLADFLYLESKNFLSILKDTPFTLNSKIGRFKLGFGEEALSNNPVEGVLPSNSAAKADVIDEGLSLDGKIKLDKAGLGPLGWTVSVTNGNSGFGSDNDSSKAFMGKVNYSPVKPLYLSASYYDSGSLKSSAAEMSVAGLTARPANATNWDRKVWEVDARYDFGKGKSPLDPPAYSDSKAILRLSYGAFHDAVISTQGVDRIGSLGFIDGIYNLNKKFYTAGRYSFVDLSGDTTASLNSVTANRQDRYSLGLGWRWSQNTILKLSYDWNKESGTNTEDADNNQLSAIVASQF